ncbi:MAG: hypothetical protein AAFR87_07075 [Bacteroidota bacterium]
MKATHSYLSLFCLLILFSNCRDGVILPSNQNKELEIEGFYPGQDMDRVFGQEHILVLQEDYSRDRARPIHIFDTDTEKRVKTIPDLSGHLISVQNEKIYVLGSEYNENIGPDKRDIVLKIFNLDGELVQNYNKENTCIDNKYRVTYGLAADVDTKGQVWVGVNSSDPVLNFEGILQVDPINNTCKIWNKDNSNLSSNVIKKLLIYKDKVYVLCSLAATENHELFLFENGDFKSLLLTAPISGNFYGPWIDQEGKLIYGRSSTTGTVLTELNGEKKNLGTEEPITLYPNYYMGPRGNEYIAGTHEISVPYPGYAPTLNPTTYLSRNGKVYASWDLEDNPFYAREQIYINGLYVNPNKTSSLWLANGKEGHRLGGLVKITF